MKRGLAKRYDTCDVLNILEDIPSDYDNTSEESSEALSTRIRIRLYPQTFCCGFKSLHVHTYADSLRFQASTRIRENNTNTPDLLTEHALSHVMNPRCCC